MWEKIGEFFLDILPGLIGGILSGGIIVGWIEIQRYRREKEQWDKADKKIELIHLTSKQFLGRWNPEHMDDKAKIRIYEAGLKGKVRNWYFIVKYEIANLTDQDILAHDIYLVTPQPHMVKPQKEDNKYFDGYKVQAINRYNLMTKDLLNNVDFPLVLPANSKTGIVFVGQYEFDYPNIVEDIPVHGIVRIKFDDNKTIEENFEFSLSESFFDIDEVDFHYIDGGRNLHWIPYMEKMNIDYKLPF